MKIGIDGRALTEKKAGIGYYTQGILTSILSKDKNNEYYIFSDREIFFNKQDFENVYFVDCSKKSFLKKTPWFLFELPMMVNKMNIDIFWGTQHVLPFFLNKKIKKLLTMHDLVYYELPESMTRYNKLIYRLCVPRSVKNADRIICDSYSTKDGILKYIKKSDNNIDVIYLGADRIDYSIEDEKELLSKNAGIIQDKYLLYVGTLEPRKNVNILLKAFEKIYEKTGLKLVICGKVGWKADSIISTMENHKYKDQIIYLNYVSDKEKAILMKNCFVFVFPSFYEGFGLPVVEAMLNKAVTIVSDSSSLKELVEKEALKFKTNNSEDLIDKVEQLYLNNDYYKDMKEYCSKRGLYFNWGDIAETYLNLFIDIC